MLLLLLGLTLAVRLWGIHDRLPDPSLGINVLDDSVIEETDRTTMGRAWALWRGGLKVDLNPHTGGWPALSFYLTLGLQYLYKIWFSLVSGPTTDQQFAQHVAGTGASGIFLFARVVGALIGVLTVYLTYRIGSRVAGRTVGLLAGAFVGANTLHVLTSQHVSDPNLLALLFVLLATPPLLRVVEGGTVRDSVLAGAMIGLAGACKYVPLVLGLPLVIAHAKEKHFYKSRALWAGVLAILGAMVVASPFLFIDWKRTMIDITGQRRALFSDWVGQTAFPISLPSYLAVTLPHAMGWPAYLLSLVGLVLLWRDGGVRRKLVWIPVLIVLVNGMLKTPQERYVLVALPFLHIAAAFAIVRAVAWARARIPALGADVPLGRAAPALLAALAIAWPLPELVSTRQQLRLPDSRHAVLRWVQQNLDPKRPTAVELYGPVLNERDRVFVVWPFFATQAPLARPAYHSEFLDGFEYHVASGEISRRFAAEPEKYPVENAYYKWLGERSCVLWESDPKTMSGPLIVVRRLPSGISTRAQRDSLFAAAMPKPSKVNRLELWCWDCSKAFLRLGDYARAEEWGRRALRIQVTSMEAPVQGQLAVALLRMGQVDSAEVHMRRALALSPKDARFRAYYAQILTGLDRLPEALVELRRAYELSGGDPRIRINIAQVLGQLGRFDEAVAELLLVPPGDPQRGLALRDAAILILNHLNRPVDALNYLRESIELDPNQEQADLVRAQIAKLEAALIRKR